ncbi:VIT family protein [Sphingomonas sp. MMS24-J13]|uniref:VIT1/CCC1 transporter family protein n=1 Tax=Sphingomonas sp. MMS24-J13 TaxID=3238686 RepID=UPI00384C577A
MRTTRRHSERHAIGHVAWLRAAVLGANDGILSTASLIVGIASAAGGRPAVLIAGAAGLVAGAFSMAAGEYVSVSSQADLEQADLDREKTELHTNPVGETQELTQIYMARGVSQETAAAVARELMEHDALDAHARDELGLSGATAARPVQAAVASATSFAAGAALPLVTAMLAPVNLLAPIVMGASLVMLGLLGAIGAQTGRAPIGKAVLRVILLGGAAMLATIGLGRLLGTAI